MPNERRGIIAGCNAACRRRICASWLCRETWTGRPNASAAYSKAHGLAVSSHGVVHRSYWGGQDLSPVKNTSYPPYIGQYPPIHTTYRFGVASKLRALGPGCRTSAVAGIATAAENMRSRSIFHSWGCPELGAWESLNRVPNGRPKRWC